MTDVAPDALRVFVVTSTVNFEKRVRKVFVNITCGEISIVHTCDERAIASSQNRLLGLYLHLVPIEV